METNRLEKLRAANEYRRDRLEGERERLERRLNWAMYRQDVKQMERLTRHLDALDRDIGADLAPGRSRGYIETGRRIK